MGDAHAFSSRVDPRGLGWGQLVGPAPPRAHSAARLPRPARPVRLLHVKETRQESTSIVTCELLLNAGLWQRILEGKMHLTKAVDAFPALRLLHGVHSTTRHWSCILLEILWQLCILETNILISVLRFYIWQKNNNKLPVSSSSSSFLDCIFLFLPRRPLLGVGVPFSSSTTS